MEKFGKSLAQIIDPTGCAYGDSSSSEMCSIRLKGNIKEDHLRLILKRTVDALAYMHSSNIIHRDISPDHILVNNYCDVRICGFGSVRTLPDSLLGKGSGNSKRVRSPLRY